MARKQNQKALYEAIRQGQAKIAEGLKTGQMRSDRRRFTKNETLPDSYAASETGAEEENDNEYLYSGSPVSPKLKIIGIAVAVQVVVLILGIWLGAAYFGRDKATEVASGGAGPTMVEKTAEKPAEPKKVERPVQTAKMDSGPVAVPMESKPQAKASVPVEKAPEKKAEPVLTVVSTGNNVIVIQGIQEDRKELLLPLIEYFAKKGIETEIVARSGQNLLVTKKGFDTNPESKGTPGYEHLLQIKKVGLLYPQETGDTKFGIKPFQDCYGLLK